MLPRIALFLCGASLLLPSVVMAFKKGADFLRPAAVGGGGAILFTGAPVYRRWTCAACHTGAPGKIWIGLQSSPAELTEQRRYRPEARYQLTVTLGGEHRGGGSEYDKNGFAVTITDQKDRTAGRLTGFGGELEQGAGESELVTSGTERRTSWTFTWVAPPAGKGRITAYVAAVDGDAASGSEGITSDPRNDDVAAGYLDFDEVK